MTRVQKADLLGQSMAACAVLAGIALAIFGS